MYAEIVINRRLPGTMDTLTYELSEPLEPGVGVMVPFKNLEIAGVIIGTTEKKPEISKIRKTLSQIFDYPLLRSWQIDLARWMSEYYMTPISSVIPIFLPRKLWSGKEIRARVKKTSVQDVTPEEDEKTIAHTLTAEQESIVQSILCKKNSLSLIHGVTGSGKTEVYVRLAQAHIAQGKQVLMLVPEIALTPQLIDYFRKRCGGTISVIHSKLSEGERQRAWLDIHTGKSQVIIGSRSVIFSPFQNLGLIVIDEEHEWTYKQGEHAPRYHVREVAYKMNELIGCSVVLGSATPSVETYFNAHGASAQGANPARRGEPKRAISMDLYEIERRINHTARGMPHVQIVDLRDEMKKGNFSVLSESLREKLAATLAQKKQAILFINRRGFMPVTLCRDCGFVVRCPECKVAMVVHRGAAAHGAMSSRAHGASAQQVKDLRAVSGVLNERAVLSTEYLVCHHCGVIDVPGIICPSCAGPRIRSLGVGTQRVEDEIAKIFSKARILRADRDTTGGKEHFETIYRQFKAHEADILIGTQIIGKGLDIPNVHLVGVILADTSLHFPDFRAGERTFQLLAQVAGRAGRGDSTGEVVIQTYNPEHYAIRTAAGHDYKSFYEEEIKLRKTLTYPPFSNIVRLIYAHPDEKSANKAVEEFSKLLESKISGLMTTKLGRNVQGSHDKITVQYAPAPVPRIRGNNVWHITIRGDLDGIREILKSSGLPEGFKVDINPL
ncbi:MAG: primosomal protein N' [Patescibacteria group bacterium]